MNWLVIVLVVVPVVCGNKRFGYRNVDKEDSCSSDDAECVTNPGILGQCRHSCGGLERAVDAHDLCPGAGCKCCTAHSDKCDDIYPGGYCGPSPCDDKKVQISDSVLCANNYVCCRSHNQAVAHPHLREDTGVLGMKAHYHTFDGLRFMFEGICTYLLMKENTTDDSGFHVWANHARVTDEDGKSRVMVKSVNIAVNDVSIKMLEGNLRLIVNGVDIIDKLENEGLYERDGIKFSFVNNQHRIQVLVEDKFTVEWNGKGHVIIELPDTMIGNEEEGGKVVGLLGNANGVIGDDLIERLNDGSLQVINIGENIDEDMIRVGISWLKDCEKVD